MCFQEQYHLCYDAAVTFLLSSECLFPPAPQPLSTSRQRNASQRGSAHRGSSRHGSHSSNDSRKKSKTASPNRSPTRSISQQRNTPMRSDSLKESPAKPTMELSTSTAGGVAHVYGDSEATSTFGSHSTPAPAAEGTPGGVAEPGAHTPVVRETSHTPSLPAHGNMNTNHIALGQSHTPVPGGGAPYSHQGSGSHTPVLGGAGAALAQFYGSQTPSTVHTTLQTTMYAPSPSPVPSTGVHSLSQGAVYTGSQSSVYTGSQTPALSGSQPLSMYGATGGSQTPPPTSSHYNSLNNTHHHQHHQLLEAQRHTPTSAPLIMDPAVAAESTPL